MEASSSEVLAGVRVCDPAWVDRQVDAALAAVGRTIDWAGLDDEQERAPAPQVVLVDLDRPDGLELVGVLRRRWPRAYLAAFVAVPDQSRWLAAQRHGCDLVVNRGALPRQLARAVAAGLGTRRVFPLLSESDLAGRLGLVARIPETPVGPLAVFHVDGVTSAVTDRCPHAGATLSEGELDGRTLTCPRHGSQFDVCTGERLRGPADDDVAVHRLAVEGGHVVLLLDPDDGEEARR